MTPAELRALAKRVCEEQPSRELDAEIAETLGFPKQICIGDGLITEQRWVPWNLKHYTTSLDAAASLMPEGWRVYAIVDFGPDGPWVCEVQRDSKPMRVNAEAPTEPAARVAAALLARAADMEASDAG